MFKSTVVQYRSWYRCWLQWISKKSYWLEEREKGWDGRAEGSSAEETEGKLQFHSCLMLMAQVLLPCWIHFYLVVLMVRHISHVWLFATLWTVACQSPLFMGFSHQESWSGLSCPPPGGLLTQGLSWVKHTLPVFPALQADSLPLSHERNLQFYPPSWKNNPVMSGSCPLFLITDDMVALDCIMLHYACCNLHVPFHVLVLCPQNQ